MPAPSRLNGDTVGSLLAGIATALQDALRILMFADKRGWGPDEFEQVRAVEEALDEAKRDFQTMGPLVNGQFYYENDRRAESLAELAALCGYFEDHTQLFRDWIRSGGPINPLWVRETVHLRRQLHRAQCRAARRIFNAEHEAGDGSGSGARCLGAFLVYRRFREQAELRKQHARGQAVQSGDAKDASQTTISEAPAWKQQQPRLRAREQRRFAGQERFRGRSGYNDSYNDAAYADDTVSLEMTPQPQRTQTTSTPPSAHTPRPLLKPILKASQTAPQTAPPQQQHQHQQHQQHQQQKSHYTPPHTRNGIPPPIPLPIAPSTPTPISSAAKPSFEAAQTTIPLHPDEPPSPPPKLPSLEDLVPFCNAVGTFERFGDRDIAFICDYCDGHIVWEDIQRLPTTRTPPAAMSASTVGFSSSSSSSSYLPFSVPSPMHLATTTTAPLHAFQRASPLASSAASQPASSLPPDDENSDEYPQWQALTVAMSDVSTPRTVVFAPLAIANHLAPMAGDWEARLWCPYCDTYLYYDSGEGDQTKYAQDEHGFPTLTDFQLHLEWHHTALPVPSLPTPSNNCNVM
ncbi:hypothetical protein SCUCBS95973_002582 [Sporothrix curviconia]|uniref:Uncharacterized protein n=1 Tax=Sporothrix curviconia TaxID=1260050 RepID=A0ABP0B8C8_9PEZI